MVDAASGEFSKLEAGFAELQVKRRPMSVEGQETWRHAAKSDLISNDLDVEYESIDTDSLPLTTDASLQGILPALQYSSHLTKADNFADETRIELFEHTGDDTSFSTLDDRKLQDVLQTVKSMDMGSDTAETTVPASKPNIQKQRLLVFLVPLAGKKNTSFGWQASMTRSSVQRLFDALGVNPEFLLNLLGRPDYWSPRTRWQCNDRDELIMCGT
jgi:hypothetical protein